MCTSTSRIHALTKTHTDTNTYPALSLWVFPTPCESRRSRLQLLLSAEGGAHALLCVTPLLFPPGLNFKSNTPPFFYQHSLITSPSSSSPSSSLPPYPLPSIFSDMIPFNSSPLSNPPPPTCLPTTLPPPPPFYFSPLFSFSFSFSVKSVSNLSFVYYDVWVR